MREFFKNHGKWLFYPAPVICFTGGVLQLNWLVYSGIGLLAALLALLIVQSSTKKVLIK